MARLSSSIISFLFSLLIALLALAHLRAGQNFVGVSLSVSRETAPPGGIAQMKVFITEPKPISTGSGSFMFAAYEDVVGIALGSGEDDTAGVAVVHGNKVALTLNSPSGSFGLTNDYPVLTVAGHVDVNAPIGDRYPLVIDSSTLRLFDASGALYPVESKVGHLVVAPGLSIHDVNPGSAVVPAGGIVTITGSGFERTTEVRIKETKLREVRYISPDRIDVVLASTTHMHGQMIRATNPDGSRCVYFSYQRTQPHGLSADAVLSHVVPLPPLSEFTTASIAFPGPSANMAFGIAIQNVQAQVATVNIEFVDTYGNSTGRGTVDVPPSRFVVRDLSEVIAFMPAVAGSLRLTSTVPVQMLGVAADQLAGTATPIHAQ